MKQCHYVCRDVTLGESKLEEILNFFQRKSMIPYDDFILSEDITYFDSSGLKLNKNGGHCRIVRSQNLSNTDNTRIPTLEFRLGKKNPSMKFTSNDGNFNLDEISKITGFNRDLIETMHTTSTNHRILMTHIGNKKITPYFDFSYQNISIKSSKRHEPVSAAIFSLVDRTDLVYDRYTASKLTLDIDTCLLDFEKLMETMDLTKVSSHNYGELLALTRRENNPPPIESSQDEIIDNTEDTNQ